MCVIFAYMFVPDTYHLLGIRRMHWGCLYFLFPEMIDSRHYITPSVGKGPLMIILYRQKTPSHCTRHRGNIPAIHHYGRNDLL